MHTEKLSAKKVSAQGRYKKQSGGHGQFGDVWIEFEPCDSDGLVFAERVVGGAVPKNFFLQLKRDFRTQSRRVFLRLSDGRHQGYSL